MSNFVQIAFVTQRVFAEPIVHFLADNGISARVQSDDCGGVDPALNFTSGTRIQVASEDAVRAKELIDEWEAAPFAEPDA